MTDVIYWHPEPLHGASVLGRSYGWRQTPSALAMTLADTSGIKIKKAVDPTVDMPPIDDQLDLGACTADADCRLFRGDMIADGKPDIPLARLWVYYFERAREGTLGKGDVGAYGIDGFYVAQHGIPPESLWPYETSTYDGPVPAAAKPVSARAYQLTKPVKAVSPTLDNVKAVLSNRQKISVGFSVYESFETSAVTSTGIVPMPAKGEQYLGGHQVLITGYDPSAPLHLICDNSWGPDWGHAGRFYIPASYILSRHYAGDWHTVQRPVGK